MHWYDSPKVLRVASGIPVGAGRGKIQPVYLTMLSQKDEYVGNGDAGAAATTPARTRHRQKQHTTSFICDTQPGHPIKLLFMVMNRKKPEQSSRDRDLPIDRYEYDIPEQQEGVP
jgi:hypothetical protein